MVTCCVRSPLHCLYRLGPGWSLLQFFFYGRTTLCHCFLRLGTLNGNRRFLLTPFWGATQSWELAQRLSPHLGSGCRDSSLGDPAMAGPALLPCALPPFSGWVCFGPVRVCVCVCVCGCVGGGGWVRVWVCGCGCLLGCVVGWSLDSFTSPCFDGRATKSFQVVCASCFPHGRL